jgi:hypothetical protein
VAATIRSSEPPRSQAYKHTAASKGMKIIAPSIMEPDHGVRGPVNSLSGSGDDAQVSAGLLRRAFLGIAETDGA